jgi:hypothetical protein
MQREFSVRVADASRVGRGPLRDDVVRQKVDYDPPEWRRRTDRTTQRRLVARTIETLRAGARANPAARRSPRPGDR